MEKYAKKEKPFWSRKGETQQVRCNWGSGGEQGRGAGFHDDEIKKRREIQKGGGDRAYAGIGRATIVKSSLGGGVSNN